MKNLRALLGLPVLETDTGEQIGEVREVIVNLERAAVCRVDMIGAGLFQGEKSLAFVKVQSIGRDAVMVADRILLVDKPEKMAAGCYGLTELCGKAVFTECGLQLGIVSDIIFYERTGEMTGYQLSDGLITDFISGLRVMPLPHMQVVARDKLIVPECMAQLVHV